MHLLATNKLGSIMGTTASSLTYYRRARSGDRTVFALVGALGYGFLEASAKARIANLAALVVFVPQGAVLWQVGLLLGATG